LEDIIENVEAVTRDDILELANELFNPQQMALTLLGPAGNDIKKFEEFLISRTQS
jgi:predicted Zn-dependent peptidase